MRIFVAGGTGAVGKFLVPFLIEAGHEVVGLARSVQKGKALELMGAKVAVADALNKEELTEAIRRTEPEVIIHELTALVGVGNFKRLDEDSRRLQRQSEARTQAAAELRELAARFRRRAWLMRCAHE